MSIPMNDKAALRRVLRAMKTAGAEAVSFDNGEEIISLKGMGERKILDTMFQTDDEVITFRRGDDTLNVHLVYGNEPGVLVSNYWPILGRLVPALDAEMDTWE